MLRPVHISNLSRVLIVSVLGAFFLSICALSIASSRSWINRPFPGFLVMKNNYVSVLWLPDWEGFKRGVKFGDIVTAVDGKRVSSGDDLNRVVASAVPGTPLTYTIQRGGKKHELTVPVTVFTKSDYLQIFVFMMVMGALFYGTALVVFFMRPNLGATRAFLFFSVIAGISFAAAPEHCTTHMNTFMLYTLPLLGPSVLVMGLYYPERHEYRRLALLVLSLAIGPLIFFYNYFFHDPRMFPLVDNIHNGALAAASIAGVFIMGRGFQRSQDPAVRQSGKIIVYSFLVGLIGGIGIIIGSTILRDISIFWGIPFLALIPLGFGYAIVIRNLLDLEVVEFIRSSLAVKIMVFLVAMGLLVTMPVAIFLYSENRRNLEYQILSTGRQTNKLIINTTRYSMLKNDRKAIRMTVRSLKKVPEIDLLRIYSKEGISFSTYQDDVGREVDMKAPQCVVCHRTEPALESVPEEKALEVYTESDGHRYIAKVDPIYNSRSCGLTDCHPKPSEKKVLGVLETRLRLTEVDKKMAASLNQIILFLVAGALLAMVVTVLFLWFFVHKRVARLTEATQAVGGGDLSHQVEMGGKDELGLLAQSFNDMVVKVRRMVDLEASYNELKKLDRMKDNLLHMVSHDLRTPMTSVLGYAYILHDGLENIDPKDQKEYLSIIIKEGNRLTRLISDLLDLQRFEAGRMEIEFEDLDIVSLLRDALKVFKGSVKIQELDLIEELPEEQIIVRGHYDRLSQVISNLLSNAVKFTPSGGTVTVRAEKVSENGGPESVKISVADNGKGIPKDLQQAVFNKFQQAHRAARDAAEGSGLGLALVREIIEYHGGSVGFESEAGQGSVFYFVLRTKFAEDGDEESPGSG